jgi:hypothetical protein
VGVGASEERRTCHLRKLEVVYEGPQALDKGTILPGLDPLADKLPALLNLLLFYGYHSTF